MKRLFIALALFLSPLPAAADDASYCSELSDLALRYLGKHARGGPANYDADVILPIEQCKRGDFANGIPALEQKLRANKFTLPQR